MPRITSEGLTSTSVLTPTTSTGPVYAVGDQVGSMVSVVPPQSSNQFRGAVIDSITLLHLDASTTAQLDLFVLLSAASLSSTDSNPYDVLDSTARGSMINCGRFQVSEWKAIAGSSTNTIRGIKLPAISGSTSAPGILQFSLKLSGGSISFTTTSSLRYIITFRMP